MHTIRLMFAGALLSLVFVVATPLTAHAFSVPFGGRIIAIRPCIGGGLVVATIAGAPTGIFEVASVVSPYLYYAMTHPTQSVLGLLGGVTACWTSPHSWFAVPFSYFYGTSL